MEKKFKKLSMLKANSLSFGGRLTLIKSVFESLSTYLFSTFKAPKRVINKLEALRRNFFWRGSSDVNKIPWIASKKVISPLKYGGLGVGSLSASNQAMLAKWWWRFRTEPDALWCKVIKSIHGKDGRICGQPISSPSTGLWYQIRNLHESLKLCSINQYKMFKKKVGNGKNTLFWLDIWVGGSTLAQWYPRLFQC